MTGADSTDSAGGAGGTAPAGPPGIHPAGPSPGGAEPVVAAVDIGGTGLRVRLGGAADTARRPGRTVTGAGVDTEALLKDLRRALRTLRAGRPGVGVAAVGVGMSGLLGLTAEPEGLPARLAELFGTRHVVLASDMVTSHAGALGLRPGSVVAAGTGAVALGTDFAGRWARGDGWGHLLGDEGGGAWIGAAGLRAAMRAHDGRPDGSDALLARAVRRFGPPASIPSRLYPHGDVAGRMAGFAPDVAAAAHAGDPLARGIWRAAARHLARTAVAALPAGEPPVVSWCGSLFDAGDLLLEPFRAEVLAAVPRAVLTPPAGSSLDGAELLARLLLDAPERVPDAPPYLRVLRPR
ncbi:N-acetylglucosamine kinase [Streptomyces zhihengii]|uniref:N-acetylglucosamine kinase n=1 Tax=Streptomyces zhihengii TaxID=1818004 RepID=UPI00363F52CE